MRAKLPGKLLMIMEMYYHQVDHTHHKELLTLTLTYQVDVTHYMSMTHLEMEFREGVTL